jgi:putative Mg2+ transporter-C (MgtC) family protein
MLDSIDSGITSLVAPFGQLGEAAAKLLLASFCGGVIGMERELRGRQAGFRTFLLVSLGCALVMLVSIQFGLRDWQAKPGVNINVDPARIAYGVMTGIGFIGAGTIMHSKGNIRGLTTAAAMWCSAAVGLAAGFGLYSLALLASFFVVMALWWLDYVEDNLPKRHARMVSIRVQAKPGFHQEVVTLIRQRGMHVIESNFQRDPDQPFAIVHLLLSFRRKKAFDQLIADLTSSPDADSMMMVESRSVG